jgi:hypothetical protein
VNLFRDVGGYRGEETFVEAGLYSIEPRLDVRSFAWAAGPTKWLRP